MEPSNFVMDEVENKSTIAPELEELREECAALRHLVISALVLLLVVSGTFNLYLWRQVRYAHKDLEAVRPGATQIIADYRKASGPMDNFVRQMAEYGRTHPDFAPIMVKYDLKAAFPTSAA